jgi:hypothetical protein
MEDIGDLVKNVIGHICQENTKRSQLILNSWNRLLTLKEQQHTQWEGLRDDAIYVLVENTTWLYHMKTRKDYLLKELKKQHSEIQQIFIKVGKI